MAIDIKTMLAQAILKLCHTTSVENMTIKQLLDETGISRQTFYNHFLDKNDLIQYIYLNYIIPDYNDKNMEINFHDSLIVSFNNMLKYKEFMMQACKMEGQNCLKDYIYTHCEAFDMKWHQYYYGDEPMPEALRFATKYHATASSSMTLSWILSGMISSPEEVADLITNMRSLGMKELFGKDSPY